MGFRPEETIYNLDFAGGWLKGLTVKVRCCKVKEFNQMMEWTIDPDVSMVQANTNALQLFLDKLVEWNLEGEDGLELPHTVEACHEQEQNVIREILKQWQIAMSGVPDPLQNGSSSGDPSQERSLGLASG